jgi:glycosyltransferase involved in cell wall biosynthesis
MANSPYVSFVVIAYNEERNIAPTLNAIATLDGLSEYEIVVVNDGSADATASIVRTSASQDPRIRLIDLAANSGRGHARRTGVRAAHGDLIATVDADIVLPRDWFNRTLAALTHCDAVAGVPVPDGDVAYIHRRFQLAPRAVPATSAVPGSNGLYRRTVFDLVEYDSSLREGEDSALNHAMRSRGLSLVTLADLLVVHQERKTFLKSLSWLFEVGKGATRQLIEYREIRQPDVATAAVVVAMIAGVFIALEVSWIGIFLPIALVLVAAMQHVKSRFHTPPTQWGRAALAVGADSMMLTAYFAGRLAGLATRVRRRTSSGPHWRATTPR